MNLFDKWIPHVQMAAGKCSVAFAHLMQKLDEIQYTIESSGQEPSLVDKVLRVQAVIPASGTYDLDRVPNNQIWTLEYVAATAAWRVNLNGSLMLASTNGNVFGSSPVLMPGEVGTIAAVAGSEVTIQITRKFLDVHPTRARSGPGNEQWSNGSGPGHEMSRDLMDTGRPQLPAPPPALIREN